MNVFRIIFERLSASYAAWSSRSNNKELIAHATRQANVIAGFLQEKDFAAIRQKFLWPLRWFVPEAILRKGWSAIELMTGPLLEAEQAQVQSGWFFTTANVPIQFKNMRLSMKLTMVASDKLIGLKFGPAPAVESWKQPVYSDADTFREEEVRIGSEYPVQGLLTVPTRRTQHPCIILLSGSGPCDKDSTLGAIKPFKDLAYGLATRNIAVLRFDKVTHTHPNAFKNDKITIYDEYFYHAKAVFEIVQRHEAIAKDKICLLGHSLGAVVAPSIAEAMSSIAGLILLAPPARPVYEAAVDQMEYLAKLNDTDTMTDNEALKELKKQAQLADSPDLNSNVSARDLPFGIGAPYWLSLRQMKPITTTKSLKKPTLVLHGGRDYQVTDLDFNKWTDALQNAEYASCRRYPGLNHAFITGDDLSNPSEYDRQANVNVIVIDTIAEWVKSLG